MIGVGLSIVQLAVRQLLGGTFSPIDLFTTGVTGAWYDPSDITTLYRDAAGTQPVTAVEQPVGLMLDKSKGLVLGPERVTNGEFGGATGWTLGDATVTIASGKLSFSNTPNAVSATCAAATTAPTVGMWLQVQINITSLTAGAVRVSYGGVVIGTYSTTGVKYATVSATGTNNTAIVQAIGTTTAQVESLSIRELPGNHAFNSSGNSANFPVLSARYNLLTKTEDFSDAAWTKTGSTIAANTIATTDPFGGNTADKLQETATNATHLVQQGVTSIVGTIYKASVWLKAAERNIAAINVYDSADRPTWFDLQNGTILSSAAGNTPTITSAGNGWYLCTVTRITASATTYHIIHATTANNTLLYNGTAGSGIYIWGADLRVANDALNQPAYQRVNTSTDYDTIGFKPYLRFNGTNQWLQTNSIDFSYGDKMFVSAGVRRLGAGIICETGVNASAINGSFHVYTDNLLYQLTSRGTVLMSIVPVVPSLPITDIITGKYEISTPLLLARRNGSVIGQSSQTQGTGNYGNYPLYIGARAGSSLWFNGRLYGMVVAGKQASAAEITSTETYLNQKTGAY